MRTVLMALALGVLAFPAYAESGALCEFLPVKEHFMGADYVPGVDVNGKPVVPADVKAQADSYVDIIKIPITIDLAQQLTQTLPQGTEMNAQVAMVEIHKDSKVIYNGQDVSARAYEICGKTPFNIEAASGEPEKVAPAPAPVPAPAPAAPTAQESEKEEIIWGEDH